MEEIPIKMEDIQINETEEEMANLPRQIKTPPQFVFHVASLGQNHPDALELAEMKLRYQNFFDKRENIAGNIHRLNGNLQEKVASLQKTEDDLRTLDSYGRPHTRTQFEMADRMRNSKVKQKEHIRRQVQSLRRQIKRETASLEETEYHLMTMHNYVCAKHRIQNLENRLNTQNPGPSAQRPR